MRSNTKRIANLGDERKRISEPSRGWGLRLRAVRRWSQMEFQYSLSR